MLCGIICSDRLACGNPAMQTKHLQCWATSCQLIVCVIARANSTYWHTNDVTIHICGYSIKSPAIQTKEAVGAKSLANSNSHQVIARLAVTQPKCS